MAEKPDDKWCLPLCRFHHTEQHNRGNELAWWASYGIDPFATAVALYASWPGASRPKRERRQIVRTVKRKPKSERQSIPEVHRPIVQRNNLRKRAKEK
jgi:CRISPR/Cas system endoribonuclease Cas6 (RAMP superfamily)